MIMYAIAYLRYDESLSVLIKGAWVTAQVIPQAPVKWLNYII